MLKFIFYSRKRINNVWRIGKSKKEEKLKKQNEIYIEIGKKSATRASASKYNKDQIARLEAQRKILKLNFIELIMKKISINMNI